MATLPIVFVWAAILLLCHDFESVTNLHQLTKLCAIKAFKNCKEMLKTGKNKIETHETGILSLSWKQSNTKSRNIDIWKNAKTCNALVNQELQ